MMYDFKKNINLSALLSLQIPILLLLVISFPSIHNKPWHHYN